MCTKVYSLCLNYQQDSIPLITPVQAVDDKGPSKVHTLSSLTRGENFNLYPIPRPAGPW